MKEQAVGNSRASIFPSKQHMRVIPYSIIEATVREQWSTMMDFTSCDDGTSL